HGHPAGDARAQPGGADRGRGARARAAIARRRPGRGLPRAPFAVPRAEPAMSSSGHSLVIVSGMSGSGKTVALNTLEDLDFYCVDNLPAELLPDFVRSATHPERASQKLAVGIDVRSRGDLANIPDWLSAVGGMGFDPRLVFFDTADAVLLKRYADTLRRHPLTRLGLALSDAIALERQVLRPLSSLADVIIDTSELNVHQLRRRVLTELGLGRAAAAAVRARRPGARVLRRAAGHGRVPAAGQRLPRRMAAAHALLDPQLRDRGLRLHRRPPPLGLPGRGRRRPCAQPRLE